jgi:peptidoglycan/LPS O-acetylase OafA/YrhL
MSKLSAILILIFVVAVFSFGTWQMFAGNFEAAFTALPFLIIIFLFVKRYSTDTHSNNTPPDNKD